MSVGSESAWLPLVWVTTVVACSIRMFAGGADVVVFVPAACPIKAVEGVLSMHRDGRSTLDACLLARGVVMTAAVRTAVVVPFVVGTAVVAAVVGVVAVAAAARR